MKVQAADRLREVNKIQLQIVENQKEIRQLTSKIIKSDYDQHELNKLNQKRKTLFQKRQENEEFLRNQQQLEMLTFQKMKQDRNLKNQLNNQYKTFLEQRHQTERETERKRIEQEQALLKVSQQQMAEEILRQRELHELYKRRVISDLDFKNRLKQLKKAGEIKEKAEFQKIYQQNMTQQNPKTNSYRNYFDYFQGIQKKNQDNYMQSVAPVNNRREISKEELVNRGIQQANRRSQQAYAQSINRSSDMKRDLRDYLKRQIESKQLRKSQQRASEHEEGVQQLHALQYIAETERNRLKQTKQSNKFPRQYEYNNGSQLLRSGYEKGQQSPHRNRRSSQPYIASEKKIYNPITNPIDFKFGYQNPYILQELAKAKQEAVGDPNLKINNLAMLGSSSIYRR